MNLNFGEYSQVNDDTELYVGNNRLSRRFVSKVTRNTRSNKIGLGGDVKYSFPSRASE